MSDSVVSDLASAGEFSEAQPPAEECLVVDVAGFEGPLDLLLDLARDQKVDLAKISILQLAEQYLTFIEAARRLRLEIAADYLVMAAWLAFLKSRLLLPAEEVDDEGPSGEELALALARRLKHLEAIREAGRRLMGFTRLGIDVFPRGMAETVVVTKRLAWDASLYDLLSAYAALRLRGLVDRVKLPERHVFSLQEARDRLVRLLGVSTQWEMLDSYFMEYLVRPELRATAKASAFSASLELVREGQVELRQSSHFAPLFVRRRVAQDAMPLAEAAHG
jgi:segregation and condensation protein A